MTQHERGGYHRRSSDVLGEIRAMGITCRVEGPVGNSVALPDAFRGYETILEDPRDHPDPTLGLQASA